MHSRAGAQTPFSSLNYGMDVSPEGRMAMRNLLKATESGLGNGETPIFPIHIFRVKKGINFNPGEPNYDLFKLACRCSARRMFPNFAFQDAPFNLKYYDPKRVETEIAYMGCRTRVVANCHDPDARDHLPPRQPQLLLGQSAALRHPGQRRPAGFLQPARRRARTGHGPAA